MKVITKMELQPDMVLGEDILDQDRVIYPAGTTITPQIIEKLKRYNLVCVTIMEDVDFATTHYAKIRFDSNFKAFERAYPLFLGQYKLAMKQLLIMGRKPADIILLMPFTKMLAGRRKKERKSSPSGRVRLVRVRTTTDTGLSKY